MRTPRVLLCGDSVDLAGITAVLRRGVLGVPVVGVVFASDGVLMTELSERVSRDALVGAVAVFGASDEPRCSPRTSGGASSSRGTPRIPYLGFPLTW